MIKNILKRKEESDSYLTHVCRHNRSRQIMIKMDETGAFFHRDLSAPVMSTDMSQVAVALFLRF